MAFLVSSLSGSRRLSRVESERERRVSLSPRRRPRSLLRVTSSALGRRTFPGGISHPRQPCAEVGGAGPASAQLTAWFSSQTLHNPLRSSLSIARSPSLLGPRELMHFIQLSPFFLTEPQSVRCPSLRGPQEPPGCPSGTRSARPSRPPSSPLASSALTSQPLRRRVGLGMGPKCSRRMASSLPSPSPPPRVQPLCSGEFRD